MKQRYKKPTGVPEQFIEATRHGWVDNRTGEVLEAIPNLVARLADYEKYMTDREKLHEEVANTFEVHKPSKSLELQEDQETATKLDLINNEVAKNKVTSENDIKEIKENGTCDYFELDYNCKNICYSIFKNDNGEIIDNFIEIKES